MIGYLTKENKEKFDEFVKNHPKGHFMQCSLWGKIKDNWVNEGVISYGENGEIKGTCNLLIRKVPVLKNTIMYAPRGPVCDITDKETIKELISGIKVLAKKYKSLVLKIDPDVISPLAALEEGEEENNIINSNTLKDSEEFLKTMKELGFTSNDKSKKFEAIQPKHVFRQDIKGKDYDRVRAMFKSDTRNKINKNNGVTIEIGSREDIKAFSHLMDLTGQRDEFVVRNADYFEKMYDVLAPENLRLYMAYYNHEEFEKIKKAKEEGEEYTPSGDKGKAIAGVIAIYYGNKVWYLYGASGNEHRNKYPSEKLQWEMMKWAIDNNCDIYDFRGVEAKDDEDKKNGEGSDRKRSIYNFKKQFRGTYTTFVGELELVFNKPLNFAFNTAEKTFRELRRKLYVLKGKKNG